MMPYEAGWMQPPPVRGANSTGICSKMDQRTTLVSPNSTQQRVRYMSNIKYILDVITIPADHDRSPDRQTTCEGKANILLAVKRDGCKPHNLVALEKR